MRRGDIFFLGMTISFSFSCSYYIYTCYTYSFPNSVKCGFQNGRTKAEKKNINVSVPLSLACSVCVCVCVSVCKHAQDTRDRTHSSSTKLYLLMAIENEIVVIHPFPSVVGLNLNPLCARKSPNH